MKADSRRAFTLVEIAVVILLGLIVAGPIVMTLRSGVELFFKADANAKVTDGVRFTMNSFGRTISPMLNQTPDIKVLLDPVIPDPVPQYMNYVYLDENSIVHKNSTETRVLEGSEYISAVNFVLPSSTAESADNFLLNMTLNGEYKTANLEVENKETLFNKPTKDGNLVSDNFVGNVLVFRTPGYTISPDIDLYDKDTMIKINNSTMPKGTVILAKYDLNAKRNNADISVTDQSTLEWYVSGSTGANLTPSASVPDGSTKNDYQYLLVDESNDPYTDDTLPTSADKFYIRTGTDTRTEWIDGGYGIIRARLKPRALTSSGKVLETDYIWSPYVRIGNKTFWETWLDAISGVPTEGFYNTNVGLDKKVELDVITETEELAIGINKAAKIKAGGGAFTVARLDYKYFDNDRLYSIWEERPSSSSSDTIPTLMTVTNYSVLVNLRLNDIAMFGLTLSNTPNTVDGVVSNDTSFNDLGYSVIMSVLDKDVDSGPDITSKGDFERGVFVQTMDGSTTDNNANTTFVTRGVISAYSDPDDDYHNGNAYSPAQVQNTKFSYSNPTDWWVNGYHRVLYSVLEYYDRSGGKTRPRYIIRVRFLKNVADLNLSAQQLADLKVRDPWFIGPQFFASEPMWFGDFVGDTIGADNKTVDVRRHNTPAETSVASVINIAHVAADRFYGLLYSAVKKIFKKSTMDLYTDARSTNGGLTDTRLSLPYRDRYLGMMVYIKTPKSTETMNIYEIDLVPGFTADEIRSILPANGKLYTVDETVPETRRPSVNDVWYGPGALIRNYNDALFGTDGWSDGSGDNGSRYFDDHPSYPGILGIQHVPGTSCTCPLENELFKWLKDRVIPSP
ncbi:MAG: hypothetical protein U2P59_01015 [Synergistota bacterium]|nr:hypothetical protein [Synergistota bacterium]